MSKVAAQHVFVEVYVILGETIYVGQYNGAVGSLDYYRQQ